MANRRKDFDDYEHPLLKKLRKQVQKGGTMDTVLQGAAEKLKITPGYLRLVVYRHREPSKQLMRDISAEYGIPIKDLLSVPLRAPPEKKTKSA